MAGIKDPVFIHIRINPDRVRDLKMDANYKSEDVKRLDAREIESLPVKDSNIIYIHLLVQVYVHLAAFYGVYLGFVSTCWNTLIFSYITYVLATIGVTGGAHRLWSHRSFKAKRPLQILLMVFLSTANQNAIKWVMDHRLHHKYTDTDADPNNINRGLFFSHIGFTFTKKHPEVMKKEKTIYMKDLYENPVLMFQRKYNTLLSSIFCFILPFAIPIIFWNESICNSWHTVMMRYAFNLHAFFLVNSAAHYFGSKTYDKNISATEDKVVSIATFGEGFHNYHHVFPSDYRNAELGNNFYNYTKLFIEAFAWLGWAYDLKTVRKDIVWKRSLKTGEH